MYFLGNMLKLLVTFQGLLEIGKTDTYRKILIPTEKYTKHFMVACEINSLKFFSFLGNRH